VCVNGLELTGIVNLIMKFVYTLCKGKCKNKYTYMVLHGCVKQCKKYDFTWGGGGGGGGEISQCLW
jgi:hypothetical protein